MRIVDGSGRAPLDLLVQQLWLPLLQDGSVRIRVEPLIRRAGLGPPRTYPEWVDAESYWVLPSQERASLLLPAGPRRATARAALAYRGLRRFRPAIARTLLAVATGAGLPGGTGRLVVQTHLDRPAQAPKLPLAHHGQRADRRVLASVGIRTGDNRKATLQLLDAVTGEPVGYAKHAWSRTSATLVTNETLVLGEIGGQPGAMRAPEVLDAGDYLGLPYLTVAPLPARVRAVRGTGAGLTPAEMHALCPVVRHDRLSRTSQFRSLDHRVRALVTGVQSDPVTGRLHALVEALTAADPELPVARRWHGDLTPWNCARDGAGQLWCWDWESSEPDVVAGLDALHWHLAIAREAGRTSAIDIRMLIDRARPLLRAAGVPADLEALVAGVFVATMVERAATLAADAGSWEASWIEQETAVRWCVQALR